MNKIYGFIPKLEIDDIHIVDILVDIEELGIEGINLRDLIDLYVESTRQIAVLETIIIRMCEDE